MLGDAQKSQQQKRSNVLFTSKNKIVKTYRKWRWSVTHSHHLH